MRKNISTLLLLFVCLLWGNSKAEAQDFKLYFANNVTDVTDFTKIESSTSPLVWREVKNNDMSGNMAEVNGVINMFASTDMKYRKQQRQFWTMRDHCLLCFRINDGLGKTGSYNVEVEDSVGKRVQTLTVSRFFYVNVPRQGEDVKIRVYHMDDKEKQHGIAFKYRVYDWNDDDLYIFQLDSKRQLTKETYRLQYVLGHTDEEGLFQTDTTTLALRDSSFQSFYVTNNHDLLDVFLISGEESKPEEEHKLRLNKTRLHPGVTLDADYSATRLTPEFLLDKHENRELINFNWIGSGLYERYDTLYVKLLNSEGEDIKRATFHVEAINEKGERIPNDQGMKYIGYDRHMKQHKILTYGRPAYMEIVASGYVPRLFKYEGAADPVTRIVDEALCSATVQLLTNRGGNTEIAVSSVHVRVLNDTKNVLYIYGKDHAVCDVADFDITFRPTADTVYYYQDAGHQYPKLLNNGEIEKYARFNVSFAIPRGQALSSVKLFGQIDKADDRYEFDRPSTRTIDISSFPSFTYNYVDMDFNMVDVLPQNTLCRLSLQSESYRFDEFPFFYNLYVDRAKMREAAEKKSKEQVAGADNKERDAAFGEMGYSFGFPANFTLKIAPLVVTQSMNIDLRKQIVSSKTSVTYSTVPKSDVGSVLREEAKEYNKSGKEELWKKDDDHSLTYDNKGTVKLEDWILQEMDDIFNYSPSSIGAGLYLTGTMAFDMPLSDASAISDKSFMLNQLSLMGGYGFCAATPDLMRSYLGSGSLASFLKEVPFFHIGFNFDARAEVEGGIKMFGSEKTSFSDDNYGYYGMITAKAKVGAWAEFSSPPNPIFQVAGGIRGGLKIGIGYQLAGPFRKQAPDHGGFFLIAGGIEAYANLHTFIFNWSGRAGITFGKKWLFPSNDDHNPFHSKYPWWAVKDKAKTVAESYRKLPQLGATTFGQTLISDVASDANPHFIDESHVVYNDLKDPANYNDDSVMLLNTDDNTTTDISQSDKTTTRHMRSKRGEHEIVVYEELAQTIDASEVTSDKVLDKSDEIAAHTFLAASIKNTATGEWTKTNITADDGIVDSKPVVTIQDDGKAACIWQRGTMHEVEQTVSNDTIYGKALQGNLVLSVYDGKNWSQPISLYSVDKDHVASEYDLIMRNDTVLVGTRIVEFPLDSMRVKPRFSYASVDIDTKKVSITRDPITPLHFFMNRVGKHSVIAMLYEKNDSIRDIYVKTLAMSGHDNGVAGSDLGANFCSTNRVKIICDRASEKADNFAILWTEMNNVAHNSGEESTNTDQVRLMLNASRIFLRPTPRITAPITLGCERDSLIMTDFDGFLDDARIKVVYSLADIETGAAVIMSNEKYFTNSFEYDISYPQAAVMSSNSLPLNLVVRNTGTSSIHQVTATINGSQFEIADSYVPPLQSRSFVVNYPISDDFDGYISSDVAVVYDNVFQSQYHPLRRNVSFRRQVKSKEMVNVGMEDIECNLIGHSVENGVNNFVVELIDHSVRGLNAHNSVHVGIYAHPTNIEPILDDAETIVRANDFTEIGGQRKAYATVKVARVGEPIRAYLSTHIYNSEQSTLEAAHVDNRSNLDNAHYITLLPHNDPTVVEQIVKGGSSNNVSFVVKKENGGLRISSLEHGSHLRVYSINGMQLFDRQNAEGEVFVPLREHQLYIISDGKELLKFAF